MEHIETIESPFQADKHTCFFETKRAFFDSGSTLPVSFRIEVLLKLKEAIKSMETEICDALYSDLHKSYTESYLTEIGVVNAEIAHTLKHLKKWMKPKRRFTPLAVEPSKSEIRFEPKGVVLIIAPWNYPFNLVFAPLIGAMAAGNCVVIKPSEEAPATANIIEKLISDTYQKDYMSVVQGDGSKVVPALMKNHVFNHVFFTGSPNVGKIIAKQAADNLVSTTLELGGKSPAILDGTANLEVAAKRIAWGKFINAGQTCVAPDYLLVEEKIKQKFVDLLIKATKDFYGENAQESPDYPRMINTKRFDAVKKYLTDGDILYGGKTERDDLYIEPTFIENVNLESNIMREEIFGPILPILTFQNNSDILKMVRKNRYPLACYYFGSNKVRIDMILNQLSFGGGCINNTLVHLGNPDLPFGGVQGSGSGQYHGWHSFECFSNTKSMVISKTWYDPALKYPPFSKMKLKWLKKLL